ncbi:prestin-like [Babylonia areolata]|uniref:prestin-like n=1 Tax=Babylonia areolata TaxID=304850 RepID=UPI003FD1D3DF
MGENGTTAPGEPEADRSAASAPLLSDCAKFTSTSSGSMELVGLRERKLTKVSEFEAQYRQPDDKMTVLESAKEVVMKKCSKFSLRKLVVSNLPILSTLRHYRPLQDLTSDAVAGLTSGIMMIPQGMAFASLSTLKPVIGLYISLFSSITYSILGTGQQSSFGCIAILSIMMGSILDKYVDKVKQSAGQMACTSTLTTTMSSVLINTTVTSTTTLDYSGTSFNMTGGTSLAPDIDSEDLDLEAKKLGVAGGLTLLCGIIFVVLGKIGLGKVTVVMSDSLVTGVTVGAAFHVGSSQLKAIFGLGSLPRQSGLFKLIKLWYSILANIHHSNPASIIASFVCILLIYLVKRFVNEKYKKKMRVPIPIELIVMILATLLTYFCDLYGKFGISIIKEVPTGVPTPRIPDFYNGVDYLMDGLVIITVAFVQTVSVTKLMGLKHNYKTDSNQEMFALGMVNIVCAVFSGYISGASVSRSVVQDSAGGKSQIASLFAALLVLLVMLFIGPYFYYVPKVALSAIIIVSLRSLMLKLLTIPDVWRKSKMDCIMFVTTVAAVVILDADIGLLVGVVVSIFLVVFMTMRSSVDVTTHIPVGDTSVWRSKENYYGGDETTNVKVIRVNSPLYFVNAEIITDAVFKKTGINPLKITSKTAEVQDTVKTSSTNGIAVVDKAADGRIVSGKSESTPNTVLNVTGDVEKGESHRQNMADDESKPRSLPNPSSSLSPISAAPFSALVLDLSGASFIDLMGVKALEFLIQKYRSVGVDVYVTDVTEKCLDTLKKSGFMAKHGDLVFLAVDNVLSQLSQDENQQGQITKL